MIKKISSIILSLILCLSVFVFPSSAKLTAPTEANTVAYEVQWDKEYYKPGDTAILNVFMTATEDMQIGTGTIMIGLNSAQINTTDNDFDTVKANVIHSDLWASFWKTSDSWAGSFFLETSTIGAKVEAANTNGESALYDYYVKFTLNRNTAGGYENGDSLKYGMKGSDLNALYAQGEPLLSFKFKVSADAAEGTELVAGVTTGTIKASPAQTGFKYIKNPGTATTTANSTITASNNAKATVGVEPCAPDAHVWDAGVETTAPTCGAAGVMKFTCTVCKSTKEEPISATGLHTAGTAVKENEVDPNCVTAGSYDEVVYCTVCNAEISRTAVPVKALGHTEGAPVQEDLVPATCKADGSYNEVVYCTVCNEKLSTTPKTIAATGEHVYATETERVNPTCTEAGYVIMACGCGETQRNTLDATGHNYSSVATDPTCTTDGYTTYTCGNCNDVYTDGTVAALGHSYDAGVVTTDPTCTDKGVKTFTCATCSNTYTEDVDALGHTAEEIPVVDATCTTAGSTAGSKCSVCQEVLVAPTEIPATGHNYVGSVKKTPTCTRVGTMEYVCSVCSDKYTEDIPALNHPEANREVIPAVAPTCTTDGKEAGVRCSACNNTLEEGKVIPSTGHTKGSAVVTAPTYTSQGYTTYTCPACRAQFVDDYVPAKGIEGIVIREPSISTIRCKDTIVLHAQMPDGSKLPEGVTVEWSADNENFETNPLDGGKLEITSKENGPTVFTATAKFNGQTISTSTITMNSKADIWSKIGGFIRALFGSNLYYNY